MIDAKGHRCYNGCPDKELQAIIDESRRQDAVLKHYGARAVFYPADQRWIVWKDLDPDASKAYMVCSKKSKSEAYFDAMRKIGGSNANIPTLS